MKQNKRQCYNTLYGADIAVPEECTVERTINVTAEWIQHFGHVVTTFHVYVMLCRYYSMCLFHVI